MALWPTWTHHLAPQVTRWVTDLQVIEVIGFKSSENQSDLIVLFISVFNNIEALFSFFFAWLAQRDELREIFNDISSSSEEEEDEGDRHEDEDLNIMDTEDDLVRQLQDKLNESDSAQNESDRNSQIGKSGWEQSNWSACVHEMEGDSGTGLTAATCSSNFTSAASGWLQIPSAVSPACRRSLISHSSRSCPRTWQHCPFDQRQFWHLIKSKPLRFQPKQRSNDFTSAIWTSQYSSVFRSMLTISDHPGWLGYYGAAPLPDSPGLRFLVSLVQQSTLHLVLQTFWTGASQTNKQCGLWYYFHM